MCILQFGLDNQFISPELYPLICQLRAWMLSFGFTFAYGGMFSKIWTVHRLTTANEKDRKVLCVITAPITLIISNQQDASFAFVALAILLCSFLSRGLIFVPKIVEISRNPKKNHLEVRAMSESVASKEEEERHQRLLIEND
ncbi:gamma-aminobutyric acid type B receptor subunit 1-like isoform X3 [Argopecten irradians]|uniref:gamma-aminobutyric acid type B receptor subunit 1-like isoform X3 n=1 Tax=Argopecten irradians TaxID=31199 RepID=UPI00371E70C9